MPPFTTPLGYVMDGHPFDVRSPTPANLAPEVLPDLLGGQGFATDSTSFQFHSTSSGGRTWPAA